MSGLLSWAHAAVWQRLPRRLRRTTLERVSAFMAPRPSRAPRTGSGVSVAGVMRASSGLGQSGRACRQALIALGEYPPSADVSDVFLAANEMVPAEDAAGPPVAGPGVLIVHVNAPLLPLALLRLGRPAVDGKVVIGYWAWELPAVPPSWHRGLPFVHEIWVPSTFVADAIRPIAEDRPIRVVPHPVALNAAAGCPTQRNPAEPFTVLTMFDMASGFTRKNPVGAVKAFRMAFGDDASARLVVKCQNMAIYPQGRDELADAIGDAANIVVNERTLTHSAVRALLDDCDVFLSLHRAEGFGLGLAEAMAAGRPVVATNWSGNVDFLGAEEGCPIGFTMVPASDPQGEYDHPAQRWAEPDLEQAAAALIGLRSNGALRARLGEAARARVMRDLGTNGYANALAACRARYP